MSFTGQRVPGLKTGGGEPNKLFGGLLCGCVPTGAGVPKGLGAPNGAEFTPWLGTEGTTG